MLADVERDPADPLNIKVTRLASMPGITIGLFRTDGRLYTSMKDRFATVSSTRGSCEWWARGRTFSSRPGSLQLKIPGEVHRERKRDGAARFRVVVFDDALMDEARAALGLRSLSPPASLQMEAHDVAAHPMLRLHRLLDRGEDDALTLETATTEALHALARIMFGPEQKSERRRWGVGVQRALDLIRDRFAENLSLEEIAAHAGMDKFHLCRAFRDTIGLPPHTYLIHLRTNRARALIAQGVPASQAALHVGMCDQSQLTRYFKRIFWMTPGQYARSRH
jgi:AraC-like DNA-binding protein